LSRAIDTRLDRIERALIPPFDPDDEFGLSKLSCDDLNRVQHHCLFHIAANEQGLFTPEEVDDSRVKLTELEASIWDEAAAMAARRAAGSRPKPWWDDNDWEALAREWGLLDAGGNLSPRK